MPKHNTHTHTHTTGQLPTAVTRSDFADFLKAKAAARTDLLAARRLRATARTAVVGLVITRADDVLVAQMREAVSALGICLVDDLRPGEMQGCDMVLFPTTDLAMSDLAQSAVQLGSVPVLCESIAPKVHCVDYDPTTEEGTSFLAKDESSWSLFAALTRAVETFRLPYDWRGIVRSAHAKK